MNLFIIGNGFDIDHGINSGYMDFKNYLLEQEGSNAIQCVEIIEKAYEGTTISLWSQLEKNLGQLNYTTI